MHCCHICGLPIETKYEQFRSDDEPATLVSMCAVHAPIGDICRLYTSSSGVDVVNPNPEFTAAHNNTVEQYTVKSHGNEQWVDGSTIYTASVDVLNCMYSEQNIASYVALNSYANVDRMDLLCLRYLNHPLYNQILGYEDGIGCVTFNSEVVGPVSVTSAKLLNGLSHTITLSDLHTITCQWMCIFSADANAVVCYENTGSNVSKFVSISKERSTALHLLYIHYMSIKGSST
jgi:hypothetical protein